MSMLPQKNKEITRFIEKLFKFACKLLLRLILNKGISKRNSFLKYYSSLRFFIASSETNASVRLVFDEFQAQLFEEILEVVFQKTAPLNVPVRDSFHCSEDGRVPRM